MLCRAFRSLSVALAALSLIVNSEAIDETYNSQFRKPVNCLILRDGNYVFGCSRFWSICTNQNEQPMQCPIGLVLDPSVDQCLEAPNVGVCNSSLPADQLYHSVEQFTCKGKPDGSYANGKCDGQYFQCHQGQQLTIPCSVSVLNKENLFCDYLENCKKTGPKLVGPEGNLNAKLNSKFPIRRSQNYASYSVNSGPRTKHYQTPKVPPSLEDVFIVSQAPLRPQNPIPVAPEANFSLSLPKTPPLLHTSLVNSSAIAVSIPTPFNQSLNLQQVRPFVEPTIPKFVQSIPKRKTFSCEGRADAIYLPQAAACTSTFWKCAKGQTFKFFCPTDLFYNIDNGACDNQQFVVACSGKLTTTTLVSPTKPKVPFNCSGRLDGYYFKNACSPSFIICSSGQATEQACPGSLLFDPTTISCQYANECGKSKPTTSLAVDSLNTQPPVVIPSTEFDCTGRSEGYHYAEPCTTFFYSCALGFPVKLNCPSILVFDPISMSCEYPNRCQNPKNLSRSTASTIAQSSPKFDCSNKPNGFYSIQNCQEKFYNCYLGHATEVACSSGMKFDAQKTACVQKNVCEGSSIRGPIRKSLSLTELSDEDYAFGETVFVPATTIAPSTSKAKPKFSCLKHKDGYYVKTNCDVKYVICSGGITTYQICPKGLVFDIRTTSCQYFDVCKKAKQELSASSPATTTTKSQVAEARTWPVAAPIASEIRILNNANPPLPPTFDCSRKPNKMFSIGPNCSNPTFVTCSNEITFPGQCPFNLVFDETAQICTFPNSCSKSNNNASVKVETNRI